MMEKKLIILGIILIIITVGFSGCTEKDNTDTENNVQGNNRFVGTWKDDRLSDAIFIFLSDGSGMWAGDTMLWVANDTKLEITITSPESEIKNIYDYNFSNNYQTLTLTFDNKPGINLILIKQ